MFLESIRIFRENAISHYESSETTNGLMQMAQNVNGVDDLKSALLLTYF